MPPYANLVDRYVSDAVETLPPARLVTMLYDGLVRDLSLAEQAIGRADLETASGRLVHAQAILLELRGGLDPSKWSGALQLEQIYLWLINELVAANVAKDAARVAACRGLVEPLRDAWHTAAAQLGVAPAGPLERPA